VALTFESVSEVITCIVTCIRIKAIEQHLPEVFFLLFCTRYDVAFEVVNEILIYFNKCDHLMKGTEQTTNVLLFVML